MSKTVTLRMDDKVYALFRSLAAAENRPLSNFIETATLRYAEQTEYADEFEMAQIRGDVTLNKAIKRGSADAKAKRGKFL